jgi:hypothetical protein
MRHPTNMARCVLLLTAITGINAFLILPHGSNLIPSRCRLADNDAVIGEEEISSSLDQRDLFASLKARQEELRNGVGKRYRVRTQKGFLNVHSSHQDGPYAVDNIVGQLEEGDIIAATGPRIDDWIPHDAGGWSIAVHGGFTWLEPLDDA